VRPWRTLAALHPELVRQLDPARNDGVDASAIAAGSARKLWWRCQECGDSWQATVGSRSAGHGCPACYSERRRRQGPRAAQPGRSLAALYPEVAAEWDAVANGGLDPAAISPGSKRTVWWRCGTCGHCWRTSVDNRTSGHGCPSCAVRRRALVRSRVDYERSLAARHPALLAELHPARNPGIDPAQLGARSGQRVWWRCATCGHEWRTAVATRTKGSGCPVCGLKRRARTQSKVPRARSLAVKHASIAGQLHPTRNPGIDPSQLGARSSLKLWWRCDACGHEWRTTVSTRTDGSGCPACARTARAGAPPVRALCACPRS
jgi:predicted  nucleic acid-binding Zn-ribbon protein